jgi:hypothetical protein
MRKPETRLTNIYHGEKTEMPLRFTHENTALQLAGRSASFPSFPRRRTTVRGKLATYQTSTIVTPLKNGVHLEISEN